MIPPAAPRVLVVDDDTLVQRLIEEFSRSQSREVVAVGSAEQAYPVLEHERPLIAFVDVNLPGAQGDALCRDIRLSEATWDLPVVAMTGCERQETVRRCFVAGADDYLLKPLDEREVLERLRAVSASAGEPPLRAPVSRRVLVVTPKEAFGLTVTRLLRAAGYEADLAHDCSSAKAAVAASDTAINLALIDLDTGEDDVHELLGLVRQNNPNVPLVTVASRPDLNDFAPDLADPAPFDTTTELEHVVRQIHRLLLRPGLGPERRTKNRVPFHSVVRFRVFGEAEWLAGYGYDLSETGVFVRTLVPLPVNKPVEVSFKLTDEGDTLSAKGLVIWSNSVHQRSVITYPFGMGIAFAEFPVAEWAAVREYVLARSRR
ncbi:MAG: response regulator [Myxococcales bacterium]